MKIKKIEDKVQGYFFISITNNEISVYCAGDDVAIAAAFATLLVTDDKGNQDVKRILGASLEFAIDKLTKKEKNTSKNSNKVQKTPIKAEKKK
jgi:hypothetical protein